MWHPVISVSSCMTWTQLLDLTSCFSGGVFQSVINASPVFEFGVNMESWVVDVNRQHDHSIDEIPSTMKQPQT